MRIDTLDLYFKFILQIYTTILYYKTLLQIYKFIHYKFIEVYQYGSEVKMDKTCSITHCKTGYKQKQEIQKYHLVFGFTDSRPSLKEK